MDPVSAGLPSMPSQPSFQELEPTVSKEAYNRSLKIALGANAGVSPDASPEEAVRAIRAWLQNPDRARIPSLNLREKKLCCLPTEICQLSELKELRLSDNEIPFIPGAIGNLQQLRTLGLSRNLITAIPPQIRTA